MALTTLLSLAVRKGMPFIKMSCGRELTMVENVKAMEEKESMKEREDET